MTKKPEEKTLGQIESEIDKAKEGKEAVVETYDKVTEKKSLFEKKDFVILLIALVLFALAIIERSKVMSVVAGFVLVLVISKMAYGQVKK